MPLWIPITLVAALFQTWRTALQQRLRGHLSVSTAGLVRYLYAVPVGLVLLLGYRAATGAAVPTPTLGFVVACAVAGVAQVLGTSLLIMAFGYRNFAVGTAYSKTDAVQAALMSWLLLHEALAPVAWLGIGVGVCGAMTLSLAGRGLQPGALLRATVQPAALCGLGAGTGFAVAGVSIKAASVSLAASDAILGALFALVVTNVLQTLMQGGYMAARTVGLAGGVHLMAQLRLGRRAVGWRLRLLVHRVLVGPGGAGAHLGTGGDDLYPPVQPILPA